MGAAAYNRGTRSIAESILREAGRWRDPIPPKKRPADWGEKTRLAAEEKARRLVASNRRYGLTVTPEIIAGAVQLGVKCCDAVAMAAAVKAIEGSA